MQRFFLYRLFSHSKSGFALIVIFILCYTVFFYKKMDATFFPYNSMFTIDFNKNYSAAVYSIKINAVRVKITDQLYWKKDFLEESLINYSKYKRNNNTGFMDRYLQLQISNTKSRDFLLKRLSPAKTAADEWLAWFARFAGYDLPRGSTIELMQYDFIFQNNAPVLKDSSCVYKTSSL